jgi:sarcosine oxidase
VNFLVVGKGMFGAATARYLAPHAQVTVVGPEASADGSEAYGAHHDEGRIIGYLGRDLLWSELNRHARVGMTELDPALITACGALTTTTDDGPDYLGVAAEISERHGSGVRTLTSAEARAGFPMLQFGSDETILHQPAAGHFSPRRYVALATQAARAQGAIVVPGTVHALRSSGEGVDAELGDGRRLRADTAIVATGAFAAGSSLLPVPVELRAKSEVYVMAELDDQQASELRAMPCVIRTITYPQLADLYVLPPIRYPDGRTYLKFGANTMIDRWLRDPAAVRAWYRHGDDASLLPALRAVLTDLLPGIRVRSWHTHRCADAYTAHYHPYVGTVAPGIVAVLGGNGRGAQAADAIGHLAAQIALTGEWKSELPRATLRPVPAPDTWNGLTLLRDHALLRHDHSASPRHDRSRRKEDRRRAPPARRSAADSSPM